MKRIDALLVLMVVIWGANYSLIKDVVGRKRAAVSDDRIERVPRRHPAGRPARARQRGNDVVRVLHAERGVVA